MSLFIRLVYLIILTLFFSFNSFAQLSGNINVGTGQTYTTLTTNGGLFQAINNQGLSGNLTVNITSNTNENGANALNQWAGNFTINIYPSSATVKIISGNINNRPLINLNGADRVTIDGRYNGSGKYLRFVNTNTGGTNFRFINDATNNTITYCIIEGTYTATTSGNIEFSTTTGTTGNDNNTISFCDIGDASGSTPINVIYSNGSTSSTNVYNSNNNILNNNIYNFYRNGQNCGGIVLAGGTTDWTISGNSFYQTAVRNNANATGFNCIYIITSNANNLTISNNYIGGSAPNCGGTAFTVSGNVANNFYGLRFTSAGTTTASNVNGNTIANINFSANPSVNGSIPFAGIMVESGAVNIGTSSGNTIGNTTTNGSIIISYNGTATNNIARGIDQRGRGSINNNIIGSINIGGTNTGTNRLEVINCTGAQTQNISISNNNIGSQSITGSIQTTSNLIMQLACIYSSVNTVNVTINNNNISNIINTSTSADARMRGIYQNNGTTGNMTINNNTLSELSGAGSSTDRYPNNCSLIGIYTGSGSTTQLVSGNVIKGLRMAGNVDNHVQGFSFYNNAGRGTFSNNKIYDLTNSSSGASPKIWALNAFWGSWIFYNNQISLTNGEASFNKPVFIHNSSSISAPQTTESPGNSDGYAAIENTINNSYTKKIDKLSGDAFTNGADIKGFHEEAEFGGTYYYNSVYIGGSATSGNSNSFAFDRPLTDWPTPVTLRNNLFVNARTGGTGSHFALGNEISPPGQNWTPASSNYNAIISTISTSACNWGQTKVTIQQWRDSSGSDKQTWTTLTSNINPSNLFNGISSGNLSINTSNSAAWLVSGKGIAITGQSTDFEGNSRATTIAGGCTDIGADEFTATPPNNPAASFDNAPGSGVTSTYTLWNRTISVINWGTGGSSYPSALQVRYYSGINHPNALFGNYSNSYWNFIPTGSLTGTTYDITINFGDNETYTITTPSSNIRLAKYDTFWYVFATAGTGQFETELNWANLWAKTRGPNSFSDYIITDGTNPLPVELCSFSANVVNNRTVSLNWVTCWEINNMGFDIERRDFNSVNNQYDSWKKIGFIEGHGTTNEQITYSFKDNKLVTGKYQYRLKQIDYNSNYEYFTLNTPSELLIGKPVTADLFQNYPNPSNPSTKVDFQIPYASKVSLRVYDITGSEVAVLINSQLEAGYYTSEFNGSSLASGIYFYRLIAEGNGEKFSKTMKLVLIK